MRTAKWKCFLGLLTVLMMLIYILTGVFLHTTIWVFADVERGVGVDRTLRWSDAKHHTTDVNAVNLQLREDAPDFNNASQGCRSGIRFSARPLPLTALASFPGTGNTWTRHLIEQMTGLATGSVHNAGILRGVFCGEERADNSVVVIKTHLRYPNNTFTPDKVLLIIRNPYDAIVANFNRIYSGQLTGKAPTEAWRKYWASESSRFHRAWLPFYKSWLLAGHLMPVVYENLLDNLEKELARILSFLGVPGDVRRAVEHPEGSFHRRNKSSSFQHYTTSQKRRINNIIDYTHDIFSKRFSHEEFGYNIKNWKL